MLKRHPLRLNLTIQTLWTP